MNELKVGDKGRIWCDSNSILEDIPDKVEPSFMLEVVTIVFIENNNYLVLVPRNLGWLAKNNYSLIHCKKYGIDESKRYWWISKRSVLPLKQKCNLCV